MIDNRWNGMGSGLRRVISAGIGPSREGLDDEMTEDERAARNAAALSHIDRLKALKREGLDSSIVLEGEFNVLSRCKVPLLSVR